MFIFLHMSIYYSRLSSSSSREEAIRNNAAKASNQRRYEQEDNHIIKVFGTQPHPLTSQVAYRNYILV